MFTTNADQAPSLSLRQRLVTVAAATSMLAGGGVLALSGTAGAGSYEGPDENVPTTVWTNPEVPLTTVGQDKPQDPKYSPEDENVQEWDGPQGEPNEYPDDGPNEDPKNDPKDEPKDEPKPTTTVAPTTIAPTTTIRERATTTVAPATTVKAPTPTVKESTTVAPPTTVKTDKTERTEVLSRQVTRPRAQVSRAANDARLAVTGSSSASLAGLAMLLLGAGVALQILAGVRRKQ